MAHDPVRSIRVLGAYFPEMIREAIKDQVAEQGMTEDDIRELIRKLESPSSKQPLIGAPLTHAPARLARCQPYWGALASATAEATAIERPWPSTSSKAA
jgi:hypothetical protein